MPKAKLDFCGRENLLNGCNLRKVFINPYERAWIEDRIMKGKEEQQPRKQAKESKECSCCYSLEEKAACSTDYEQAEETSVR